MPQDLNTRKKKSDCETEKFFMFPKEVFYDTRITPTAKVVLIHMLDQKEKWKFYHEQLAQTLNLGKTALKNALDLLVKIGYLQRERIYEKGQHRGYDYTVEAKLRSFKEKHSKKLDKKAKKTKSVPKSPPKIKTQKPKIQKVKTTEKKLKKSFQSRLSALDDQTLNDTKSNSTKSFKRNDLNDRKEKVAKSLPLSKERKERVEGLRAYCDYRDIQVSEKDLRIWTGKYSDEKITAHFDLLLKAKNVGNHAKWMEKALKEDYMQKNSNVATNHKNFNTVKKKYLLNDLTITKTYATHEPTAKDFQFTLDPDFLMEQLKNCYQNYRGKRS